MALVISFIGWSRTGKTTLIVKLIKELSNRGYSVAAIKNSHHNITSEKKGSDSDLYKIAGAQAVALNHGGGTILNLPKIEWTIETLNSFFPDHQIIIGEGLKTPEAFRVLVSGSAKTPEELKGELSSYDLILTDEEDLKRTLSDKPPILSQKNITPLLDIILKRLKTID